MVFHKYNKDHQSYDYIDFQNLLNPLTANKKFFKNNLITKYHIKKKKINKNIKI